MVSQTDPLTGPRVFLDLKWGNRRMGRVVISLRKDACPKTAENFRALCTGEMGRGKMTGVPAHYKGCPVHRVVPGFCIQASRRRDPPREPPSAPPNACLFLSTPRVNPL